MGPGTGRRGSFTKQARTECSLVPLGDASLTPNAPALVVGTQGWGGVRPLLLSRATCVHPARARGEGMCELRVASQAIRL